MQITIEGICLSIYLAKNQLSKVVGFYMLTLLVTDIETKNNHSTSRLKIAVR